MKLTITVQSHPASGLLLYIRQMVRGDCGFSQQKTLPLIISASSFLASPVVAFCPTLLRGWLSCQP
jgi:hypothetical protein